MNCTNSKWYPRNPRLGGTGSCAHNHAAKKTGRAQPWKRSRHWAKPRSYIDKWVEVGGYLVGVLTNCGTCLSLWCYYWKKKGKGRPEAHSDLQAATRGCALKHHSHHTGQRSKGQDHTCTHSKSNRVAHWNMASLESYFGWFWPLVYTK